MRALAASFLVLGLANLVLAVLGPFDPLQAAIGFGWTGAGVGYAVVIPRQLARPAQAEVLNRELLTAGAGRTAKAGKGPEAGEDIWGAQCRES